MTFGDSYFKLKEERLDEVNELKKAQDEADTRILLHAKHAAADYDLIMNVSDDTGVFVEA